MLVLICNAIIHVRYCSQHKSACFLFSLLCVYEEDSIFCATVWNLAETRKRLVPSRMPKASGGFGGRDLLSWLPI